MNLFFWKGMEETSFKKDGDGYLFFPYGIIGKGYRVDEAKKNELATFIRKFYGYSSVVLIIGLAFTFWIAGLLLLPVCGLYVFKVRRLLAGAPQTDRRLSLAESNAAMARTASTGRTAVLVLAGGLMTALSAFVLYLGIESGDQKNLLIGGFGLLFFGFGFVMGVRMALLKRVQSERA
jgi:hypothetical protein